MDDVAAAAGIHRRLLEKGSRRELGRGITDIASQNGHSQPNHLFRTFREHFGMSPRRYRENARAATG